MDTPTDSPIAVEGLRKSFGEQVVLDGITFHLACAQVTCILGRSGSGKSVLLKLLMGLEKCDAGSIRLLGLDVVDSPIPKLNEVRKKIGFLFQNAALYDSMSIEQNVEFPLLRHLKQSRGERRERVRQVLASVGLEHDLDKLPAAISGGMKKRVGLARALALEPSAVLFDEPTAGLDPISAAEIARLIIDLRDKQRITCLVVTHDLHTARSIADRLIVLDSGKVSFDGDFGQLKSSTNPFIIQYLKDAA